MSDNVTCECGKPADSEYSVWNGRDFMDVCLECWVSPEAIATEATVRFIEGGDNASLEECLRIELGFREMPWTPELQAFIDKEYCEWYLEGAMK